MRDTKTERLSAPAKGVLIAALILIAVLLFAVPFLATSLTGTPQEGLKPAGATGLDRFAAAIAIEDCLPAVKADADKDKAADKEVKAKKASKKKKDAKDSKADDDGGAAPSQGVGESGGGSGSGGGGAGGGGNGGGNQGVWHPGWTEVVHHPAVYEDVWHDEIGHYADVCNTCGAELGPGLAPRHLLDTGHESYRTAYVMDSPAWSERVQVKAAWDETIEHPGYWE